MQKYPFIYGAQYYRAPTPDREYWAHDMAEMRKLGFNMVKFWVQWRWSEPAPGQYDWSDLDELMTLAARNNLKVTLNLILDVAPAWIYQKYPESIPVDANGVKAKVCANICRQIGGYPGPCYSHDPATAARQEFSRAAFGHFKGHPALAMWDVWNEPENNLMRRDAELANLFCYCPACHQKFIEWLQKKYTCIGHLNRVWGRCYAGFAEVELPYDPRTVNDFIDWREFHLDKLTGDAAWRLQAVKAVDPDAVAYLHVVANSIDCFNYLSGVDDFALARSCDVFGSTITMDTLLCAQALSAAQGKVFYNAEWHINFGSTAMHQRIVDRNTFLHEGIAQIGWGVKGFLYWQYRAESLGIEAPAWGIIRGDGSPRPVAQYVAEFIEKLSPYTELLSNCRTAVAETAIWRSRRNELFQFCKDGHLRHLRKNVSAYADLLYELNLPFTIIDSASVTANIPSSIRLLIMPDAYYLSDAEAEAVDRFLRRGGVVLAESFLGAYQSDSGRHSGKIPGCGLSQKWNLEIFETTSSFHLSGAEADVAAETEAQGDVKKALKSAGSSGGEDFLIRLNDGTTGAGALECGFIRGQDIVVIGKFKSHAVIVSKKIGDGEVFVAATRLGIGAAKGNLLLKQIIKQTASRAGISSVCEADGLHVDFLYQGEEACIMVVQNRSREPRRFKPELVHLSWRGLFHGGSVDDGVFCVMPLQSEVYVKV